MQKNLKQLDFATLSHLPIEEALNIVREYCCALETSNAELTASLEETRLLLHSFVKKALIKENALLDKPATLDISLRDFLYGDTNQTVAFPQSNSAGALEAESTFSGNSTETILPPAQVISEEKVLAGHPAEASPAAPEDQFAAEDDAELTETLSALLDDTHNNALPNAAQAGAGAAAVEPPQVLPEIAEQKDAAAPAKSGFDFLDFSDSDLKSAEWSDSPLAAAAEFGGPNSQRQRNSLAAWMRNAQRVLSPEAFSSAQKDWLSAFAQGKPSSMAAGSAAPKKDNTLFNSIQQNLQKQSAIWNDFSVYANQLLRDWSLSIDLDPEETAPPNTYFDGPKLIVTEQATARVKDDEDIQTSLKLLNKYIYHIDTIDLAGCEQGSPLSSLLKEDHGLLVFRDDWLQLGKKEKLCLLNWQLHSIVYRNPNLLRTIKILQFLEDTPEDLGCTLIKRTASAAMGKGNCSIPADLIMEMSSIWGTEQLEDLDDLLISLYEATNYQPFMFAREFILSPCPLVQIFDLSADLISLQLTDPISASQAVVAQICGIDVLNRYKGDWMGLLRSKDVTPYLCRRLAGLWTAAMPKA